MVAQALSDDSRSNIGEMIAYQPSRHGGLPVFWSHSCSSCARVESIARLIEQPSTSLPPAIKTFCTRRQFVSAGCRGLKHSLIEEDLGNHTKISIMFA